MHVHSKMDKTHFYYPSVLTSIPKLGWRKHDSCRHRGCLTLTISFDLFVGHEGAVVSKAGGFDSDRNEGVSVGGGD